MNFLLILLYEFFKIYEFSSRSGSIICMSVEMPSFKELLQFVEKVEYGDWYSKDLAVCGVTDVSSTKVSNFANDGTKFSRDDSDYAKVGGALHLSSVLPAVCDAIGTPVSTAIHHDPSFLRKSLNIPSASRAIVVLVDGLGYWNIVNRIGHAPYLRSLMKEPLNQRFIYSCLPSTTVAAMGTFGTGTCPGLTCMTGYTQKNNETGALAQLIQFRDAPLPENLQLQPTIFELLVKQGVRADSVSLPKFENSPLTRAALRGARYISAKTPRARICVAANTTLEPGLTYMYLRDTDKVGHNYGCDSDEWIASFEQVDAQLRLLRKKCAPGTLIIITADHGMIQSDPSMCIDIAKNPKLSEGVSMVAGEPRSVMLYAKDGVSVNDLAKRWADELEDKALVRTKRQAISDGVFGEVCDRANEILGDVIVQAANCVTIVDSRTQTQKAMSLPSVHGSMTRMELEIPCLIDLVD